MSLATKVSDLATRIGTEIKTVRTEIAAVDGAAIDDTTPAADKVYSSSKIEDLVDALETYADSAATTAGAAAVAALVDSAPGTLDTLDELAAALGDDASFATTTATALGNRLRVDAVQGLNGTQRQQGRDNLDVYSTSEIGSVTTDFVATFEAALI